MKHISVLDFRKHSKKILDSGKRGERMIMTYRGKPVFRLEPINDNKLPSVDDPFYHIAQFAQDGGNITNPEIDKIVYGI